MLNLTQPRYVMPVHGDHKRLRLHAKLAESVGIEPEDIFRGRNGLPLDVDEKGARFGEHVQPGWCSSTASTWATPRTSRCATGASSPPTACSSSSRRSPPTTARSSPPGGDLPRRCLPGGADAWSKS